MKKIVLRTKRLLLRKPEKSDAKYFPAIYHDKEATKWTHVPHPYTIKEARAWIKKNTKSFGNEKYNFVIVLPSTGEVIGASGFVGIDRRGNRGNIGYFMAKKHRNQGYVTEATEAVIDFGFRVLKLNRININHVKGNEKSRKVIKKLGAKYEGLERKGVLAGDKKYKDHLLYSILVDEWKKRKKK